METASQPENSIHFETFELKLRTRELYRSGIRLKIRGHPVDVLAILLENPGELVTREELKKRLWPEDTFVDFEQILNNSVGKLRDVLSDCAESPKYIETLPRLGYRFIAPVTKPAAKIVLAQIPSDIESQDPVQIRSIPCTPIQRSKTSFDRSELGDVDALKSTRAGPAESSEEVDLSRKKLWGTLTATTVAFICIAILAWYGLRPLPPIRVASYSEIASVGQWFGITATDGMSLYVNLLLPNGNAVVPIFGGQLTPLSIDLPTSKDSPNDAPFITSASPDGSRLLVEGKTDPFLGRELWNVDVHGRGAIYIGQGDGAVFSPDGRTVAYATTHGDLYTVPSGGGKPKLLLAFPSPSASGLLAWSPDGRKIRFTHNERLWEVMVDGSNPHELLPNWRPEFTMFSRGWTPDGKVFLFVAQKRWRSNNFADARQLWVLDERRSWLFHSNPKPVQLTSGAIIWSLSILSKDGNTVYGSGMVPKGELVGYNAKSKQFLPYLGGVSAEYVNFSRDGNHLVYVTYPDGTMWRAERDGSGLQQLSNPPFYPIDPKWSPDGAQILFFDLRGYGRGDLYTIPSHGGEPTRLLQGDEHWNGYPEWSSDGERIVFDQSPSETGLRVRINNASKGRILELSTRKITDLPPCPKPCYFPRWSPDGRYILKLAVDHKTIFLLDLKTNKWSQLGPAFDAIEYPLWSRDGRTIYLQDGDFRGLYTSTQPGIYRIHVTGGQTEKVVDLKGFKGCGSQELVWSGLDPEDTPLLLRNIGTYDIYALALER